MEVGEPHEWGARAASHEAEQQAALLLGELLFHARPEPLDQAVVAQREVRKINLFSSLIYCLKYILVDFLHNEFQGIRVNSLSQ